MKLIAQDLDHLLARFLSCITSPLLDRAGGFCLGQLQTLKEKLSHLLKCILHFCAGRFGIQLPCELPEALIFPFVGCFDQAKKTHLVLYCSVIQTAHNHVWLVLSDFSVELEEVSNPLSHLSNVKGRIGKPRLTMLGSRHTQFAIPGLHKDLS